MSNIQESKEVKTTDEANEVLPIAVVVGNEVSESVKKTQSGLQAMIRQLQEKPARVKIISLMDEICEYWLNSSQYEEWLSVVENLGKVVPDLILIVESNTECCANCKGQGEECDDGFAWVYCTIRKDIDEKFNGDSGENKGCTRFMKRSDYVQCEYAKQFNCRNNHSTQRCEHRVVHKPIALDYDGEWCYMLSHDCPCHDFKVKCKEL
jgi:hypothetical protein